MSQNQAHEKYDNGEKYSGEYIEDFWTDGNDSQETGSSVSNAMDTGTSYVDTVTHVQAETFQMPEGRRQCIIVLRPDCFRHSHSSDIMCIPENTQYGSTCASQTVVVNS